MEHTTVVSGENLILSCQSIDILTNRDNEI